MPDPVTRFRARLLEAGLDPDVVDEVLEHARELYRAALERGQLEAEAIASVEAELADLPALVRGARARAVRRAPAAPEPAARRPRVLSAFVNDLAYGVRILSARPAFAVAAVLTLALGIGANTALFSVLSSVLLAPLPFPEPDRLVNLWEADADDPSDAFIVSQPNFADWTAQSRSFAATAIWEELNYNIAGAPEPEQVAGMRVSSSVFSMLGVAPRLGRTFTAEEDAPGHDVVVISDALWKRRYAADHSIVGRTIRMNGRPFEVIGVMPAAFCFTQKRHAVWVPIQFNEQDRNRGSHSFFAAARLKPGVDIETARAEMSTIGARLARQYDDNRGETATVTPMEEWGVRYLRPTLLMLQGAVGLVLLIGCVNVANLLLAQATVRRREFAIRAALGAGTTRVISQLLAEGLVLASAGAAAGVGLAWLAVHGLASSFPPSIRLVPFRDTAAATIDLRVLGFTLLAALATGILFSIAPVLTALKTPPSATLRGEAGRSATAAAGAFRAALMAVEVALAVVVLAGAGLMLKSMWRLIAVDPGLDPKHVLTLQLALPQEDFYGPAERGTFCADLTREIGTLPGVQTAGATSHLPLSGANAGRSLTIEGRPAPASGEGAGAAYRVTCPGFFASLDIPLKRGRDFTDRDIRDGAPVAIVNETTATRYWPGEDPVGKRFKVGDYDSTNPWLTIVGVVGDVRHFGLDDQPRREFYRPYPQAAWPVMTLTVRTAGEPLAMTQTVRAALRRIDPDQAVTSVRSMEEVIGLSMGFRSFPTMLLGIFGTVALMLAAIGVYGVVGYLVSQRTREIGIRIALGAGRAQVMRLVVSRSLLPIAIGLAAGIAGALASGRLLTSLLFDVQPTDPGVLLAIVLVLGAVGTMGSWLPARRAASVDPLVVLRNE